MVYVQQLSQLDKGQVDRVGGKNANLGEMIRSGIRVPPGFAVTVDGYRRFVEHTGVGEEIERVLAAVDVQDADGLDQKCGEIRDLFRVSDVPEEMADEIYASYESLCRSCGQESVPVAARSSATSEDLPDASFAGQQDTYLWVMGAESVLEHMLRCWASLFTARAVSYRIRQSFPHDKSWISVGVQKMVNSKVAGVMFTLDPSTGDPSQVVLEGNWGLGETVAAGEVTPDYYRIDKVSGEINEERIGHKHIECVPDPERGRANTVPVDADRMDAPCLEREELEELVRIARRIEDHYGSGQDIEWAIDRDLPFPENVFVVQTRPETVWSNKKVEPLLSRKSSSELLVGRALKTIHVGS